MQPPRTRYKVVERGRRLEVLDTWNGDAPVQPRRPVQPEPAKPQPSASPLESLHAPRIDSRGRRLLDTQGWYDAKGPRRIVLTEEGEAKLKGLWIVAFVALFILGVAVFLFWPLLFVVGFFVMRANVRDALRKAATQFLDDINQPAGDSSAG
jgi:hypothetical protein